MIATGVRLSAILWLATILRGQGPDRPIVVTVAGRFPIPDGAIATATPLNPGPLSADPAGNLYFIAQDNVYKLTPQGRLSRVFGGICGLGCYSGDGRSAAETTVSGANTIATDLDGNLYVATGGNRLLKVPGGTGVVRTVAGDGTATEFVSSGDGGDPLRAKFSTPYWLTIDRAGTIYVGELVGARTRRISNGIIDTIVPGFAGAMTTDRDLTLYMVDLSTRILYWRSGPGPLCFVGCGPTPGFSPDGASAVPTSPVSGVGSLAAGPDGSVYFVESGRIRKIARGVFSTVAGSGLAGYGGENHPAITAPLNGPQQLAVDGNGNTWFNETVEPRIRRVSAGTITTVGGTGSVLTIPRLSDEDPFAFPIRSGSAAVDHAGNVYFNDDCAILRLDARTGKLTTVAGRPGECNYNGDNLSAGLAQIIPYALAVGPDDSLYFLSMERPFVNNGTGLPGSRLRRLKDGIVSTVAGTGVFGFYVVADLAVDQLGNIYIAIGALWRIDAVTGTLAIVPASTTRGSAVNPVHSVAVNSKGEVYVSASSDSGLSYQVLKIANGLATPVAGTGGAHYYDGPAAIAFDRQDNLYFTQGSTNQIRKVSAVSGQITAPIGAEIGGYNGDSMAADSAKFLSPTKLAFDAAGNLYVVDSGNSRIRKVLLAGTPLLSPAGGNGQRILQNERSAQPLRVSANAADGSALPNVTVTFRVTNGQINLSAASATTGPDGSAQVFVTAGLGLGRVVVEGGAPGLPPVQFGIEVIPLPAPVIAVGGIVSAGLSDPAVRTLSPGSIATVFGRYFRILETSHSVGEADISDGRLPDKLDGVCVLIGSQRAPVLALYPGQINFQVPDMAPGTYKFSVLTGCDTPNGLFSNEASVTIASSSAEFLYLFTAGDGKKHILAVNSSQLRVGPRGAVAGLETEPAAAGDTIVMYAIGLGATSPAVSPGQIAQSAAGVTGELRLTIGGVPSANQNLLYVGVVPGTAGLYQINVTIPAGVPAGVVQIRLSVGGTTAEGYLALR